MTSVQRYRNTFAARELARWLGSATYLPVPALLAASVAASTAITGATETATAFSTKGTIPANTLAAGTVIRVRAQGIHTATTGAETHDMALKIGSVTVASKTGINPADNDLFYFDAVIVVRDIGATGHVVATGSQAHGVPGTATAIPFLLASTALDTTVDNDVAVVIDRQATATDTDSARLDVFVCEIIG